MGKGFDDEYIIPVEKMKAHCSITRSATNTQAHAPVDSCTNNNKMRATEIPLCFRDDPQGNSLPSASKAQVGKNFDDKYIIPIWSAAWSI